MKLKLVRLDSLSGEKATIYSLYDDKIEKTLFENFIIENINTFNNETIDIINRLKIIGEDTGARLHYFKENEGNLGDGVCALYDKNRKKLRLYCVRFGSTLVVLGGGGFKSKNTRAFQETKKLENENYILREFVKELTIKMSEKEIKILTNENDTDYFEGNLEFEIEFD